MDTQEYHPQALLWDPLQSDTWNAQIVEPMGTANSTRFGSVEDAVSWAVRDYLNGDDFSAAARAGIAKLSGYEAGPVAMRRTATLVVPSVTRRCWAPVSEPERRLGQTLAALPVIQQEVRTLSQRKADDSRQSSFPLLNRVETECVLPTLILMQGAGPAIAGCLQSKDPKTWQNLRRLAEELVKRMPQVSKAEWRERNAIVSKHPNGIRIQSWALSGLFLMEPTDNPRLSPEKWRGMNNEPLFQGYCLLMQQLAKGVAKALVDRRELKLSPDVVLQLSNLYNPESPFNATKYYSVNRGIVLNSEDRDGQNEKSPERAKQSFVIFDAWCRELSGIGRPFIETAHMERSVTLQSLFSPESWNSFSQPNTTSMLPSYNGRQVFAGYDPTEPKGMLPAWVVASEMLNVRNEVIRAVLRLAPQSKIEDLYSVWGDAHKGNRFAAEKLNEAIVFLSEQSYLPSLGVLGGDKKEHTKKVTDYWNGVFCGQNNETFGLKKPATELFALLPAAFYRRVVNNLKEIMPETTDVNALATNIWKSAKQCAMRSNTSVSVEQSLLAGALAESGKDGFSPAHAYSLAFRVAMGSGGKNRLVDTSVEANSIRNALIRGEANVGDVMINGGASIVVQLFSDFTALAKANNGTRSLNTAVVELAQSQEDFGKALASIPHGDGRLGAALKHPEAWEMMVDSSYMREVSEMVKKHQTADFRKMLGSMALPLYEKGHALMREPFGSGMQECLLAGIAAKQSTNYSLDRGIPNMDRAVLASALENVFPAIDLATSSRAKFRSFPDLLIRAWESGVEIPPDKKWGKIYGDQIQNMQASYPSLKGLWNDQTGITSVVKADGFGDRELQVLLTREGKSNKSLLALVSECGPVVDASMQEKMKSQLCSVFVPNSTGVLAANGWAAAWATIMSRAFEAGGSQSEMRPIMSATSDFLSIYRKVRSQFADTRIQDKKEIWDKWDRPIADAALGIKRAIEKNPIPSTAWASLRDAASEVVHGQLIHQAKKVEQMTRSKTAVNGVVMQSNAAVTLLAGCQIAAAFAQRVARDLMAPTLPQRNTPVLAASGPEMEGGR